jgi:N-acetylglucosaminyldiphosphoundecaprenol N-acetyl-beta-D-mannosaminyltransferase
MNGTSVSTVALFGLPISNVSMAEAVERIADGIEAGTTQQIATANLDFARNARKNSFLQQVICDCSLVLPDGAPMLWASWLLGRPLKQRVTGVDLIPELAKLSSQRGYRIFVLGSKEENARMAIKILEERYPGALFVGQYSPVEQVLGEMDDEEILSRIHAARPDILLVAFGNPKQELWIDRNRERLGVRVAIGIGGSLDMIAGTVRRAPKFIQKMHMEWMFRLLQEPRRLLPRYVLDAIALMRQIPREFVANRRQPERPNMWPLEVSLQGHTRLVHLPGALSGSDCKIVESQAALAAERDEQLVLDMTLTERVEADGVGCLLEARRTMIASGRPLWMAGVTEPVRRVLQSASLVQHMRLAPTVREAVRLCGMPERRKRFVPQTGQARMAVQARAAARDAARQSGAYAS